jgi:glycosyltransferase involved in cell wall biosynthesis
MTSRRRAAERPRVLVATHGFGASGGDRWLFTLEGRWIAEGLDVTHFHITGDHRSAAPGPPVGCDVIRGSSPGTRAIMNVPTIARRMFRASRSADVVLVEPIGRSVFFQYVIARLARRRVAIYSQGIPAESLVVFEHRRWRRALTRWAIRRTDAMMCVSPRSMESAAELGTDRGKLVEIRPGIDVDHIRSRIAAVEDTSPLPSVPFLIVGCGFLSHHKGFDRLIHAVAELRGRGHDVGAVIIGSPGDAYAELTSLTRQLELDDAIRFITSTIDPIPLFAGADLFVHAARSEACPLVVLECLAVGTPVIAHDAHTGGPRLVLDNGTYGDLVDASREGALADAIEAHLRDPSRLQEKASGAKDYLRRRFSIEGAGRRSADVLRRLASAR